MKKHIIFLLVLFFAFSFANAQQWNTLSSGTKGAGGFVFALTQYNGNLIVGGLFDSAGGAPTGSIAQWNRISWDTIGLSSSPYRGIPIYAETVYKDTLIVSGGLPPNCEINQWNGTTWGVMRASEYNSIGITEIRTFVIYAGDLYASGTVGKNQNSTSTIAIWNGNNWDTLPSGVIKKNGSPSITAMVVYNGNLYVGGVFDTAGNAPAKNIAMWNGTNWSAVGDGFNSTVSSLCVSNGTLYAAGIFDSSGTQKMNCISSWDGSKWNPLGSGIQYGGVTALVQYGSLLCAAGSFDSAGSQRANNIAFWDGTNWSTLGLGITGNSPSIFALSVYKGALIAAGVFDTAGGMPANNIAEWLSPLGIAQIANKSISVHVYPNPNNGRFTLSLSNVSMACNTEIYNVLGEKVYTEPLSLTNNTINLSGQPSGVYLYRVITETGNLVGEGKVVVQQ